MAQIQSRLKGEILKATTQQTVINLKRKRKKSKDKGDGSKSSGEGKSKKKKVVSSKKKVVLSC